MASLKLTLTDAAGRDLNDYVTVDLFSQRSSSQYQTVQRVQKEITIDGMDISAGRLYRVMVSPANHRTVQFFVNLSPSKTVKFAAAIPVNPDKVASITGPAFDRLAASAKGMLNTAEVPRFNNGSGGYLQGPDLYSALDQYPLLKAGFLNIVAKSAATKLQDGNSCLDHYAGLVRMEQDRVFLKTTAALVEEVMTSNAFHRVTPALHDPMPGYKIVSSYKTFDRYGNLQITFQRLGDTGDDYAADVDIDDAQGIEHLFQVLRNIGGATNPYDIHDILIAQDPAVDAGYDFVFGAAASATA